MSIRLFVAVVAALCTCNGELLSIQQNKLDIINDQTSADILNYIVDEIKDTADEEQILTQSCETKVNGTIKACDECHGNICAQDPEIPRPDIGKLLTVIKPVPEIAKFIGKIGKKVGKEAARFGKKIGKFFKKIGGGVGRTIKKVGGVLNKVKGGIKKIGSKIGSHVKRLGKGVAKIGRNIGRGVGRIGKNIVRGVGRIGKKIGRGVGRFGKNIGRGLGRFGKKVGHGIKRTGKKIWGGIKKLFGKRSTRHLIAKRCVHSCPVCNVLDTNKNTEEQIVGKICGSSFVSRQKQIFDKVRGLEDTYNYIIDKPVVTKVEYETSSIVVVGGKMAFKKSFITFQTDKIKKRFQLSGLFQFSNIDDMAIKISKDVLAKMF
ncbi:uncharacterized protein LOC127707779 [Mytilus californianus]|uniref:uncharacterized protein LOC127707779 n=1 Tax=Mytilus californianus TaxID=6549 RepID=UPI0022477D84|nr:uncharacterized protein LOC127707779 [Mytilus californianus]